VAKPFSAWAVRASDNALCDVAGEQNLKLKIENSQLKIPPSAPTRLAEWPWLAVRASMSIPLILPAVRLSDGEDYLDGGLRANLPLPPDWRDYDEVWLLVATDRQDRYPSDGGLFTEAIRTLNRVGDGQIRNAIAGAIAEVRSQKSEVGSRNTDGGALLEVPGSRFAGSRLGLERGGDAASTTPLVRGVWPEVPATEPGMFHFDRELIGRTHDAVARMLENL